MKIIIYVDFKSSKFNKDFSLSNALLEEHNVLLVTNTRQLGNAIENYDILLLGYSIDIDITLNYNKPVLNLLDYMSIESVQEKLKNIHIGN